MDDELQRLVDIEAIRQLKARYFRYIDTKQWEAYGELYVEDIDFRPDAQLGGVFGDSNLSGRAALIERIAEALADATTVHVGYLSEITITGPDTANAVWAMSDYVTYPSAGPPVGFRGYGHYHEDYLRTADGWRIKDRTLTRLRIDPLEGGLPAAH